MSKYLKGIIFWLLLAALLFAVIPTGFMLILPGTADNLDDIITVQGGQKQEGQLYMVTVTTRPASLFWLVYGIVAPNIDVVREEDIIPPDMTEEEYQELMETYMEESQQMAEVVALRRSGYPVEVTSDGVEVIEIMKDSPAAGILREGDVIVAVDGQEIQAADELVQLVRRREIGDRVNLTVKRGNETRDFSIPTEANIVEGTEVAAVKVYIQTKNWRPLLPLQVEIATGSVTGPSAGMMFALEIIDQLDPVDLTGGRRVAGTGTIDLEERIGSIGGVRQKVVAAAREGAEYFLVPEENFQEAKKVKTDIQLIPVSTLADALRFLRTLQTNENAGLHGPAFLTSGIWKTGSGTKVA